VTPADIDMCDCAMGHWRRLTRDKTVISSGTRKVMYKLLHLPSTRQRLLCKSTVPERTWA